jgi:hypothetical protein
VGLGLPVQTARIFAVRLFPIDRRLDAALTIRFANVGDRHPGDAKRRADLLIAPVGTFGTTVGLEQDISPTNLPGWCRARRDDLPQLGALFLAQTNNVLAVHRFHLLPLEHREEEKDTELNLLD